MSYKRGEPIIESLISLIHQLSQDYAAASAEAATWHQRHDVLLAQLRRAGVPAAIGVLHGRRH